jgi:hypothetical protein
MKKSIFLIKLLVLMLPSCLPAQKLETLISTGALLSKSSLPADTLHVVPKDSVVCMLSDSITEGYVYVRYADYQGYIPKDILSQTELPIDLGKYKLNQFDANGKKDSLWKDYLDENWHVVKDSTKAKYYHYAFYFHGRWVVGKSGFKHWKLHCNGDSTSKNKSLVALNGEYIWTSKKGTVIRCYFMKGQYIWDIVNWKGRKDTKRKQYAVTSIIDFRKKYKGEPSTATHTIVLRDGRSNTWYLRFDTVTWSYNEGVFF